MRRSSKSTSAILYPQSSILAPATSRITHPHAVILRGEGVAKNQEEITAIMNSIAAAQ